ncbi:unnamed protein product [Didymodactylos carnosus]|uniref:Uncharacterized protein n=1 Tax=Didymodactylos carnosus TaxID=1234261 RepID=A0A813RXU7_9BILA|nr:unnamed protein product [Didymodactylos carnosus]CAF0787345.1 unnamed protein product [Didymodactylos carnosus]CAF3492951.1 unnamed protein product [Didymodactylos carnosus]CAF3571318.1 unnamed protein product [Didymodactylos carnosus]
MLQLPLLTNEETTTKSQSVTNNLGSSGLSRSVSSARFQIAKVYGDGDGTLSQIRTASSIPADLSNTLAVRPRIISSYDETISDTSFSTTRPPFNIGNQQTIDFNSNCDTYDVFDTLDTLPHVEHYRNLFSLTSTHGKTRPTLEALHDANNTKLTSTFDLNVELPPTTVTPTKQTNVIKFGWIKGVLIRCILNIFGVMLFLRLSWVTGQAGLILASVIVIVSTLVTIITALSMSAICTNGEVKGGGTYYLISRSLGPGVLTMTLILFIALIGLKWETTVQIGLLITLSTSILNFLIGTWMPISQTKRRHGFEGYSWKLTKDNWGPKFKDGESFQHVFGVFFPSVTGILAGANISGNLKNPSKAIPLGTIIAIIITSFVYLGFCIICGITTKREVLLDSVLVLNQRINCTLVPTNVNCKSGLNYNYQTMRTISAFGPIITAASLVGAPKVFQAVCRDMIFPCLKYFAVGNGQSDEPHRAYFLTYFIAVSFTAIGELNVIAPIISNFFLMTYALVNYSCFDASLAKSSGWRPAFGFYNKWISLLGALLCIFVMFIINWSAALITFVVTSGIYLYVRTMKPEINWGSSVQAHTYRRALNATLKLGTVEEHVKNFRPQALVLSGNPICRPAIIDLVSLLTHGHSLMICGHVILDDPSVNIKLCEKKDDAANWLKKRNSKAFYSTVVSRTVRQGAQALLQCIGIGKMRPNLVFMGFKNDWLTQPGHLVNDYFNIIHDALDLNLGIGILRLKSGLDFSDFFTRSDDEFTEDIYAVDEDDEDVDFLSISINKTKATNANGTNNAIRRARSTDVMMIKNTIINKGALQSMNIFRPRQISSAIIDVWWLSDDGGLTLLIPYLLRRRKRWKECQLRIFSCVFGEKQAAEQQHLAMASLLSKFRINYNDLHVLDGLNKQPNEYEIQKFNKLIQSWDLNADNSDNNETKETSQWKISALELEANKDKIKRGLRLHEMLLEYSSASSLIIV